MDKKKYIKYEDKHKLIDGIEYKWCCDCNNWYLMTSDNFKVQPSQKDGFSNRCILCQKNYNHNTYMKNQRINIDRARNRILANKEEYREYKKEWNIIQKDHMRIYNKEFYKNHKDTGVYYENLKKWYLLNPDKAKALNEKRRHKNHNINKEEWKNCKEYFNNSCAYCGLPAEEHYRLYKGELKLQDLHKEHVDDDGVNNLSNCVPSCGVCNSEKSSFDFDFWYCEDNPKYNIERYNRIIKWLEEDYKQYIQPSKPKRKYNKKINKGTT